MMVPQWGLLLLLLLMVFSPSASSLRLSRDVARGRSGLTVKGTGSTEEHGGGGRTGIIIVDHGSRKKEANEMLMGLANVYKDFAGAHIVEPAHMELAEPSIKTAYQRCVEQGATHIICHPFFLSPGRHVQEDIPLLMKEASGEHPEVTYTITPPLGVQEGIIQLIDKAVVDSLSSGANKKS